ncbi:MAG: lysoplasmalogenase [Thaumarchaeota archaeon]|nr:lysoplasmalogenase [Nitrososphaerota archaeon]
MVTAIIQVHPVESYYHWVLTGLVLGLIGDICLALKGNQAFTGGLVAFLLGHIMYLVAFSGLTRSSDWFTLGHFFIVSFSLGAFYWLRPYLGAMLVPVVIYVIVISLMLSAAWVAFLNPETNWRGSWTILLGALCFYVSDLFVARDRFVNSQFINRLLGLPLYYGGQFCIAFSVGLI